MYGHPFYRSQYPSYNPHTPYSQPGYCQSDFSAAQEQAARARAQALAAQRARRHQYLPDEDEDSGDEWEYNQLGPRERAYLDAQRKRDMLERMQRQRAEEEEWQRQQEQERKWQKELDRRQKEAEAERAQLLEQRRRALKQKHKAHPTQRSQSRGHSVPINVRRSESHEQPSAEAGTQARSPSRSIPISDHHDRSEEGGGKPASPPKEEPPRPQYDEHHDQAASRIQQQYRIHRSYRTIQDIENEFGKLKQDFTWPSSLDFQTPGSEEGHVTIPASPSSDTEPEPMEVDGPEGKLAYTSANYAFHQYSDLLDKLLVKLDGVESWGDKKVRERRRSAVKSIEMETQKLDRYWRNAWRRYILQEKEVTEKERKDGEH